MRTSIFATLALAVTLATATGLSAQTPQTPPPPSTPGLTLTTSAFEDGGIVPNKYTAAATAPQVSPQLSWSHVPEGTVSFVLILRDPDVSVNRTTAQVLHWLIFNIPATATGLPEGVPIQSQLPDGSIQAPNKRKEPGYLGPGAGAAGPYHHYIFELLALDTKLTLGPNATLDEIESAVQGHILGKGILVGRFHRP